VYLIHLIVLGLGDHIHLGLGSLQLDSVSRLQLRDIGLESLVFLVGCDDLVSELLTHDVRDVVPLLIPLVQQLTMMATRQS